MEYYRRGVAPWIWILVVLAALVLLLVVWWAVAAGGRGDRTVIVPRDEEPIVTPVPTQPAQPQEPVVVERERPVNIYIERDRERPRARVVPRDQEPPEAEEGMQRLNLPDQFRFGNRLWQPTGEVVTDTDLQDTGSTIEGSTIYARRAGGPYSQVFLESDPGSGVYLVYTPQR